MSFTDVERKQLLSIVPGLTFDSNGEALPPRDMPPDRIVFAVNFVGKKKRSELLRYNFLMGAMIAQIPRVRGCRTDFCRANWGEAMQAMMTLAWVYEAWSFSQHVPLWGWSHYHESAGASIERRCEYVERNRISIEETGKALPVKVMREECARAKALKAAGVPFETNESEQGIKNHSTNPPQYILVERKEGRYQADTETGEVTPLHGAPLLTPSQEAMLAAYARCCPGIQEEEEFADQDPVKRHVMLQAA
jgi:hypothetical protein